MLRTKHSPKRTKKTPTSAQKLHHISALKKKTSPLKQRKAFMSTAVNPLAPDHEAGFDLAIKNLHLRVQQGEDPQSIISEQNKMSASLPTREWTVRDTLAIMPHFLQLIDANSVFMKLAHHRMNNLRAQLRLKEEEALAKKRAELNDDDGLFMDHKMARQKWMAENTIDHIPVDDLVRVEMQILLSATQYVMLSYQNYCKNTFALSHDHDMSQTPISQRVLDVILDHLEHVPHLTFYRIHYQQALNSMTAKLIGNTYTNNEISEQLSKLDTNAMRSIFLARSLFSQSTAFKEALKVGFKEAGVLVDSTMLAANDPLNQVKLAVMHNVIANAHTQISVANGGLSAPLGHLLLEIEMSMGVRFPKLPKHILHVKNYYNMTKIAKAPQNQMIQKQYSDVLNLLAMTNDLGEKNDAYNSVNFINNMAELDVDFPEELWLVPVERQERIAYFNQHPEAHAMWLIYSKVVNEVETCNRYMEQMDKVQAEIETIAAQQTDENSAEASERVGELQDLLTKLNEQVSIHEDTISELQLQYRSKARLFRKNNPDIVWDEEEVAPEEKQ